MCSDKTTSDKSAICNNLEMSTENCAKAGLVEEKKSKKPINHAIWTTICVAVIIIICPVAFHVFTKVLPYKNACTAMNTQQYTEAIELFSSLGDYKDSKDLILFSRCELGTEYINEKEFDAARQELEKAGDYQRAIELLTECDYQEAIYLYNAKKYKEALQLFQAVDTYMDSHDYITKIYKEQKYEAFNPSGKGIILPAEGEGGKVEMATSHDMVSSQEECEEILEAYFYGTWYDETSGKPFIVDQTFLNGKRYCVRAAGSYFGEYQIIYYEPTTPNVLYCAQAGSYLNYPFHVDGLMISSVKDDQIIFWGMNITPEEYREQELAWEAQQPQYSDSTIIDKTTEMARNRLSSGYGVQSLYHNLSVESSNVEYDWTTQTYTCQLSITYSTNMFDIWGTSNTSYFVEAEYIDTGYGLSMTSFYCY